MSTEAQTEEAPLPLCLSVELEEILSLADRILVMFGGRIVGEVAAGEADERTLGLMMAGARAA